MTEVETSGKVDGAAATDTTTAVVDETGREGLATETLVLVAEPPPKTGNPAMKVAKLIAAALLLALGWHALSDRYTPSTTRADVAAYVAQVAPRVSGRVTEIDVADNAIVEAGAPMFTVDERPFRIAAETARAQLQQAAQGIEASTAQLAAAEANVAQARARRDQTREDTDRSLKLFQRGRISKAQRDQAQSALETADATLDAAIAEADAARRQLGPEGASNPQIQAARLKLEQAEYDLVSTKVAAPASGLVTNLNLALGQYIGAGAPALTFIEIEDVWISAEMRENQLGNVKPGDPVNILFDAVPGEIFRGTVDSISWGINPGKTQVGGLPVNQPITQWFEPARRMPVRISLEGGLDAWPRAARLGGKVDVVIMAAGRSHPISWIAAGLQRLRSIGTIFY
ncbi:MAG: HlyD family secretion protein [Albidovulum sp.]